MYVHLIPFTCAFLPTNYLSVFMNLARDFAAPTKDEILRDLTHPGNRCQMVLSEVDSAWGCFQAGHPPQAELISIARTFRCLTDTAFSLWVYFMSYMVLTSWLLTWKRRFSHRPIPFHISSFVVKGSLQNNGAYFKSTDLELSAWASANGLDTDRKRSGVFRHCARSYSIPSLSSVLEIWEKPQLGWLQHIRC